MERLPSRLVSPIYHPNRLEVLSEREGERERETVLVAVSTASEIDNSLNTSTAGEIEVSGEEEREKR